MMTNDWTTGWIVGMAIAGLIGWLAMEFMYRSGRIPSSLLRGKRWRWLELAINIVPFAVIMCLTTRARDDQRGFWTEFLVTAVLLMPFMFFVSVFYRARRQQLQESRQENTAVPSPSSSCSSAVPLSHEEKRISNLACLALLMGILLYVATIWFIAKVLHAPGAAIFFMFGSVAYITFGRWPGTLRRKSTTIIAADPEQIWNTITFRADRPYYRPTVARIEGLAKDDWEFRLHYFEISNCTDCGLVRNPESMRTTCLVKVLEQIPLECYTIRSRPEKPVADWRVGLVDEEVSRFRIEQIDKGRSKVTLDVSMSRPKFISYVLLSLGNASRELLGNLKAHLEDGTDDTIYGVSKQRLELARNAPCFCGCRNPALANARLS